MRLESGKMDLKLETPLILRFGTALLRIGMISHDLLQQCFILMGSGRPEYLRIVDFAFSFARSTPSDIHLFDH